MRHGDAYIEGFFKVAEEIGVDPVTLCKAAAGRVGMLGKAWGLIGRAARGVGNYGSHLFGGRVAQMQQSVNRLNARRDRQIKAITQAGMSRSRAARADVARYSQGLNRIDQSLARMNPRLAAEQRAVRNARLWTAGLGAAGAGFAGGAMYGVAANPRNGFFADGDDYYYNYGKGYANG